MEIRQGMGTATSRVVQRPLTISVRPEDGQGTLRTEDLLSYLRVALGRDTWTDQIQGIQRLFDSRHEITFTTTENKENFIAKSTPIKVGNTQLAVEKPRMAEIRIWDPYVSVYIYDYPIEEGNDHLHNKMIIYGEIADIQDLSYKGTAIRNGTRCIKYKKIEKPIPTSLFCRAMRIRTRHEGQDRRPICSTCRQVGHYYKECPEVGSPMDLDWVTGQQKKKEDDTTKTTESTWATVVAKKKKRTKRKAEETDEGQIQTNNRFDSLEEAEEGEEMEQEQETAGIEKGRRERKVRRLTEEKKKEADVEEEKKKEAEDEKKKEADVEEEKKKEAEAGTKEAEDEVDEEEEKESQSLFGEVSDTDTDMTFTEEESAPGFPVEPRPEPESQWSNSIRKQNKDQMDRIDSYVDRELLQPFDSSLAVTDTQLGRAGARSKWGFTETNDPFSSPLTMTESQLERAGGSTSKPPVD